MDDDDIDDGLLDADDQAGVEEVVDEREVKLLYVTPERIARSKVLGSTLQKMHTAGSLARIVVDEAHWYARSTGDQNSAPCSDSPTPRNPLFRRLATHSVSQAGHDFRPDYKKLAILRTLYPGVPITAVTATCSRKVLPDLLRTLGMKDITSPTQANRDGTVLFTSPLYRPNLRYSVVAKPSKPSEHFADMASFVKREHLHQSGIVYTLSKKVQAACSLPECVS